MTTTEADPRFGFGALRFHAENDVRSAVRRTVRWAVVLVVALAMLAVTVASVVGASPGDGWPPAALLAVPGFLGLLWSVYESFSLLTGWLKTGWAIDVHVDGLIESRFGRVRNAMPFRGGVLSRGDTTFTSPDPVQGHGRFTLAHFEWETASAVADAVRHAARAALVDETLASLEAGTPVVFGSTPTAATGPAVTATGLRLEDGTEFAYPALELLLWDSYDGSRTITKKPDHAVTVEVRHEGRTVLEIPQTGPNATVLREVLLELTTR